MKKATPEPTEVVHLRLPSTLVKLAGKLARAQDRPRAYILVKAIREAVTAASKGYSA